MDAVRMMRVLGVLVGAAAAFAVAATLLATAARPDPGPCNDTWSVPLQQSAACAAPVTPAWLVLGGGVVAAAIVVVGARVVVSRHGRHEAAVPNPREDHRLDRT
jgi:hypothetical protein